MFYCDYTLGTISFWDIESATQVKFIEGRRDLSSGRRVSDMRTAESSALSKHFKSVAYSPDGTCILAGGHSKYVCLYAAASGSLLGKFELSMNRSLDGMSKQLRSDQLVDGVALETLQSGNESDEEQQQDADALPGAEKGGRTAGKDDGSRSTKPALITSSLKFSYSGREWAAATSQGLQVFGLDESLIFAPEDLTIEATPENVAHAIKTEQYAQALVLALQLSQSETEVLRAAVEAVPVASIEIVIKSVNPKRYKDLFSFLSKQIVS